MVDSDETRELIKNFAKQVGDNVTETLRAATESLLLELTSSPEPEEKNEPGSIDIFTPRERDCLRLLLAGKSNKQIARALGISIRTVDNHVDNMLRKTGTNSRLELFSQIKTASLAALIA